MAELYPLGWNRIFYRATGFNEPAKVTVDLLDPCLVNHVNKELTKVSDVGDDVKGLYFFDYNFCCEGPYIAYFYEYNKEGEVIETWSQAYSIRKETKDGSKPFRGDNVINT